MSASEKRAKRRGTLLLGAAATAAMVLGAGCANGLQACNGPCGIEIDNDAGSVEDGGFDAGPNGRTTPDGGDAGCHVVNGTLTTDGGDGC